MPHRSNTHVDTAIDTLERKIQLLEERGMQLHHIVQVCEELASAMKLSNLGVGDDGEVHNNYLHVRLTI